MVKTQGRPLGSLKEITTLLRSNDWVLEVDENFPSNNYMVRKNGSENRIAYCVSLESGLKTFFNCLLLETIKQTPSYTASIDALRQAILETHAKFNRLLTIPDTLKNEKKIVEKKTPDGEGALP